MFIMLAYGSTASIQLFSIKKRIIRLMRRWTKQIRALELFGEKNRLGGGSNLGQAGEICASGAPNDFSRSPETPNTPHHYSEEPIFFIFFVDYCLIIY
jgi:hypothetical protein